MCTLQQSWVNSHACMVDYQQCICTCTDSLLPSLYSSCLQTPGHLRKTRSRSTNYANQFRIKIILVVPGKKCIPCCITSDSNNYIELFEYATQTLQCNLYRWICKWLRHVFHYSEVSSFKQAVTFNVQCIKHRPYLWTDLAWRTLHACTSY
mgnify:CR=1 FL=1